MKETQKLVVLGLITDGEKILVSKRLEPKEPEVHEKWDLIGGTNELGEPLTDTLRREISEETGLTVKIGGLLPKTVFKTWDYHTHLQHTHLLCYLCKKKDGTEHLGDSMIGELKWVTPKDALTLDMLPTAREFIEMYTNI